MMREVAMIKKAFAQFDKDGDGTVSSKELGNVMRNLGKNPTEEEIAEMIDEVDADQSGSIGLTEFCTLFAKARGEEPIVLPQQLTTPPISKKPSAANDAAAATARRLKGVGCTALMPGEVRLLQHIACSTRYAALCTASARHTRTARTYETCTDTK